QADIVNNKLYEDAFEWRFEFPQLLDDDGKFVGFDIVIGNPPYVDVKALDNNQVKEYFKKFSTTTNRINLYSIFIEQGHRILNTSGVLCYINPNSMLVNSSYTKLRELIVSDLNTIIKLPDNIFESATVETIILLLVKHSESNAINGKYYLSSEKADLKNIDFKVFDKHTWESDPDIRFNIFTDDCTISLLKKIEEDSVQLAELCDFSLGITPYDKAKGHSQEFIKSKGFHSTAKLSDEYVPLIKGSNIHKYCVCGFGDEYLKYTKELGAPRQHRFFTDEKIIFRQILSSNPLEMIVAYSDSEHYFTQIGFSVIPKDKQLTSVKYLVGILNSRLMNYFHTAKYLDSEKITFPKILIENCKQFPIKRAEEPTQIIDLVDEILEAKRLDPTANTTALETQIDQMVYALYNLTPDEIALIEK
ncbi:MAG: TaqI-like C-terminal specificity domain-containing protein, partial [Anaerovoracaceae bacterium]